MADGTRAEILTLLMSARARIGGELAHPFGVNPSTTTSTCRNHRLSGKA
jgi:hypothetical protein